MAKIIELESVPSSLSLYMRALFARKAMPVPEEARELARVTLSRVCPEQEPLDAYRAVCGFPAGDHLPATYPFVLAAPLHLALLVSDEFPFPVMGIVHVENEITQYRRIRQGELLDIECSLHGPRLVAKGLEFDLLTNVYVDGELLWSCVSTLLRRGRHGNKGQKVHRKSRKVGNFVPENLLDWQVPGDTGRRYAGVSGDRNPIHLSALTAKLFGFPRAIAHGMWTKAHCLAAVDHLLPEGAFKVSVAFKLPVFLPASVQFQYRATGECIEFVVKDCNGKKPHLAGIAQSLN